MKEIITAGILFTIFLSLLIASIRSFREKGFLFNNAYIHASQKERENMSHKWKYYRQSGIVLLMVSLIFLLDGIAVLLSLDWTLYIVAAIVIITFIYAIVSSIIIGRKK